MDERKICKKCGKIKRSVKRPLCEDCYINKIFPIWKEHSEEDIEDLIEVINIWINTLEIQQKNMVDISDLNDIINYHWYIFHREYSYERKSFGEQLTLMYRDIKKFQSNYSKQP